MIDGKEGGVVEFRPISEHHYFPQYQLFHR
jgi:hypothetical protein